MTSTKKDKKGSIKLKEDSNVALSLLDHMKHCINCYRGNMKTCPGYENAGYRFDVHYKKEEK